MLKVGKLESDLLEKIVFENLKFKRPEVLIRAGIGEDCAVIDYGEYECIMSTDPITAAIEKIGSLSVHISCNDIASNGVEPLGIMLSVMLPFGTTEKEVELMMKQASQASCEIGVEIIGGHTEITRAVNQPVIVSTAIGRGIKGYSQKSSSMEQGDSIMMTKLAGLEGTGIIATDLEEKLKDILSKKEIEEAKAMLDKVSVVKEGVIAGQIGTSGMHDVTEGGILGAIWEMCKVSGLGAEVWKDEIPVSDITKKVCKTFELDYLRLISSGAMLIIAPQKNKDKILKKVEASGIEIKEIGKIKGRGEKILLKEKENFSVIDPPKEDELYKVI